MFIFYHFLFNYFIVQLNAVTMDDYIVKYQETKREAHLLMLAGDIKGYVKKLMELENIRKLFKKCA